MRLGIGSCTTNGSALARSRAGETPGYMVDRAGPPERAGRGESYAEPPFAEPVYADGPPPPPVEAVPSRIRSVDHGITLDDRDVFKMAEKIQTNDATLRMLAALDFDG
jgi:hypothetical protein